MNEREVLEVVRSWLRFAEDDLETAERLLKDEGVVPRHVCQLAYQAAEKAITGVLSATATPFPFHHDLDALRNLLPESSILRQEHPDLAELTEWGLEGRYPADWQDATVQDAERTARQARAVFESAITDLIERGIEPQARTSKLEISGKDRR